MRTRLVAIGNSRGVRIPKTLMEQTGLSDELELELEICDHAILIRRRANEVRAGCEQAFAEMAR